MKYCKKCFRNVREDVDICPYCGAPGLEEYGSSSSGEDFSCSRKSLDPNWTTSQQTEPTPPPKRERRPDAYSIPDRSPFILDEEEDRDAYGNVISKDKPCNKVESDAYGSKTHSDTACDNAPDTSVQHTETTSLGPITVKKVSTYSAKESIGSPNDKENMMRVEYLRMLKNIDGITKERIEELMRKYDEQHGNGPLSDNRTVYRTTTTTTSGGNVANYNAMKTGLVFIIIFGFFSQSFGIIALIVFKSIVKKSTDVRVQKLGNTATAFIIIFVIIAFLSGFFGFSALF